MDINVAQYEKTIQSAFREVADGLAARGTYDDQVASLERLTKAQQSRLDLSDMRFRNGVDPTSPCLRRKRIYTTLSRRWWRRASRALPTWSICTAPSAAAGSNTPVMRHVQLKTSVRSRPRAPHRGAPSKQVNSDAR